MLTDGVDFLVYEIRIKLRKQLKFNIYEMKKFQLATSITLEIFHSLLIYENIIYDK